MSIIRFLRAMLRLLFRIILAVIFRPFQLIKLIYDRLREICSFRRRGGREVPCLPISKEILRKPDPLIYSQSYLTSLGMSVTWDNPDIVLMKNGVQVDSHNIIADTDYDMAITIHNGSNEAPAIGLKVHANYRNWGIGGADIPIGNTVVDLPVRGSPNEPMTIQMPWRTPSIPGHFCIKVELDHIDDLNPANNIGQENTDVHSVSSNPGDDITINIPIRHKLPGGRTLRLETTGYTLPEKPLYPPLPEGLEQKFEKSKTRLQQREIIELEKIFELGQVRGEIPVHNWTAYRLVQSARPGHPSGLKQYGEEWLPRIVEANSPKKYPAPSTWQPLISKSEVTLAPEEETTVDFTVKVPSDIKPGSKQRFQVNAFDNQTGLVGGVELIVDVI